MIRRAALARGVALADALRVVRDALRAGTSLGRAVERAARLPGSPFAHLGPELLGVRALAQVLEEAAGRERGDAAFALLVLSVQARTGGDPCPAVEALESCVRRSVQAGREVRSLTAQARTSARGMLLLTPGFLGLLAAVDPRGTLQSLARPAPRAAVLAGLGLQALGALWISRIVAGPLRAAPARGRGRLRSVPVVRAVVGLAGAARERRRRAALPEEAGRAAELLALALDAGLAPAGALQLVAPCAPGECGRALCAVAARLRAGVRLQEALSPLRDMGSEAERLAEALAQGAALGVPLAGTLRALAEDVREARSARLAEEVRRASVKVLLPLGVLVLPAFVLACLVPLFLDGLRGVSL